MVLVIIVLDDGVVMQSVIVVVKVVVIVVVIVFVAAVPVTLERRLCTACGYLMLCPRWAGCHRPQNHESNTRVHQRGLTHPPPPPPPDPFSTSSLPLILR